MSSFLIPVPLIRESRSFGNEYPPANACNPNYSVFPTANPSAKLPDRWPSLLTDSQLTENPLSRTFETVFENGIIVKFDGFITLNTDQMMMVVGIGLIEFVVFMTFGQF